MSHAGAGSGPRHLTRTDLCLRRRSGDDGRTRRTDVRIGIPGQHVRKDRGVPSGSRSPESFSLSVVFIDREIPHFLLSDLINVPLVAVFEHQRLLFI